MKDKRVKLKIFHYDFLKNRKGILISEGLKLVLTIIGISILFYFGFNLVSIFLQDADFEQAQESLLKISNEISHVEEGRKKEAEFFIDSPNEWGVFTFPFKDLKPTQCKGDYCVCVCEYEKGDYVADIYLNKCDEEAKGFCKDISVEVTLKKEIRIEGITSLKISLENEKIILEKI